ncbi:hypothetical protein EYR40_007073 [Pleurotus pulmonarius]|nr:hypothetical protein EYR36_003658 [Pleurotus pulmonarius]KAF4599967.1 hypothetical protein EYR40_007073 [Pleurotus pulmonarius]
MPPPRTDAVEFVPGRSSSKVSVKDPRDGTEIHLEDWKKTAADPGPVASLHQGSTQTQSSPLPLLSQQGHDQTASSRQSETRYRSTLFVPPWLCRQDLASRVEPEFWDPYFSTTIDATNTSLTDPHDPPCASDPSYDHGYTSRPPYSDQGVSPSNGDTTSQVPTLITPTSSHAVLTPKYTYLRRSVTPSIGGPPSPPTTPSTGNTSLTSSASRLNTDAPTFIPSRRPTKASTPAKSKNTGPGKPHGLKKLNSSASKSSYGRSCTGSLKKNGKI